MYQIVYQGFDTLDISFQVLVPPEILETLEAAKKQAEETNRPKPTALGPSRSAVLVMPHGKQGGYSYLFNNGETGAIFAVKKNNGPFRHNLFVSLRAACLLERGYSGAKAWLCAALDAMGFPIQGESVNRIDFAIDIQAPGFELDFHSFVTPAQSKQRLYWSKDQDIADDGSRQAVARSGHFESVTIGTMPKRQVILYDKRRAAIDLRQPYWFDVWGLCRQDPLAEVWRVEIRAGRDALDKLAPERTFAAVEASLPRYLSKATSDIRYVIDKDRHRNVTRAPDHPLWTKAKDAFAALPDAQELPGLELDIRRVMRDQRIEMSQSQSFGNAITLATLQGYSPEEIANNFSKHVQDQAIAYLHEIGREAILRKASEKKETLTILLGDVI